ncbi:Bcr/CflA family efflux MFS transporter [Corynebacterium sp. 4HC-13]|uniref:multidrug effflux MFS transporter n=1 Tax=Corynebacterium anserum TaxID=2684406 RepID=UPI0016396DBB|nr:multidrug effflux MFS transporter [Corynebacterium anserum]MBC2681321.1 Bcr/CflA family efflux MFS transporter [Corynebacterium anserum]
MLVGLALLSMGGPLGTDMYLPSLPIITEELHTVDSSTQLTLSTYMIGMGLGQLVFGPISDMLGRKKLLVVGMALGILSSAICAMTPTIGLLIVARFVQGVAGGIGVVLARAIIADRVKGAAAAKAFSVMMLIMGVAPVVAPLIGGVIEEVANWRTVFWVLVVIAVVQTIVAVSMPESLPKEHRQSEGPMRTYRNMVSLLKMPSFLGYTLAYALGFGTMFAFISGSSVMMQEQLGLSPLHYSWAFALNAVFVIVANTLNVRVVSRFGSHRLQGIGVGMILGGSVALLLVGLFVSKDWGGILPLVLLCTITSTAGCGLNLANSTALAQRLAEGQAGAGSAALGAMQFVVAGIVSPLAAFGDNHVLTLGILMSTCAVIATGGTLMAHKAERSETR